MWIRTVSYTHLDVYKRQAQTQGRWAYTKRLNTELGKKIAGAIVRYAEENHADVIVFEYLEMQGKISGKKKQKLHLWRKRDIQRRCGHQAHRKGTVSYTHLAGPIRGLILVSYMMPMAVTGLLGKNIFSNAGLINDLLGKLPGQR